MSNAMEFGGSSFDASTVIGEDDAKEMRARQQRFAAALRGLADDIDRGHFSAVVLATADSYGRAGTSHLGPAVLCLGLSEHLRECLR